MSAQVRCDHCGWIGSEFDCHACLAPVGSEVAFTALTDGSLYVPLAVNVQTSVDDYDGEGEHWCCGGYLGVATSCSWRGADCGCAGCRKDRGEAQEPFRGVDVYAHNKIDPEAYWNKVNSSADKRAASLVASMVAIAAATVQTSVDDYDVEDDRDTDPPPPMPIGKRCYFCGDPAVEPIYHGMPACGPCKRRAVGRKR